MIATRFFLMSHRPAQYCYNQNDAIVYRLSIVGFPFISCVDETTVRLLLVNTCNYCIHKTIITRQLNLHFDYSDYVRFLHNLFIVRRFPYFLCTHSCTRIYTHVRDFYGTISYYLKLKSPSRVNN